MMNDDDDDDDDDDEDDDEEDKVFCVGFGLVWASGGLRGLPPLS